MPRHFEPAIDIYKRRRPKVRRAPDAGSGDGSDDANDDAQHDPSEIRPEAFPHAALKQAFDLPWADHDAVPGPPQRNLKHQHFAVLNAILHKSLLDQDYPRAAHAFGLLLRTELNGQRIDLRKKALWGIGAEILLHSHGTCPTGAAGASTWFSEQGFGNLKRYLERLCLQYTWRKSRPHDVTELDFYPVMLGWWIFQVQSRFPVHADGDRDHDMAMDVDRTDSHADAAAAAAAAARVAEASRQQLKDGLEILEALEAKIQFPPYDRSGTMLRLHRDVLLWLADVAARVPDQARLEHDLRAKAAAAQTRLQDRQTVPDHDSDEDEQQQ